MFVCLCADVSPVSPPGSSGDSEDCVIGSQGLCVPTQKSYSSSETLKAFDQHQDQTRWGPTSSPFSLRAPCLMLPSAEPRKSFWSIGAASDAVSLLFISALRRRRRRSLWGAESEDTGEETLSLKSLILRHPPLLLLGVNSSVSLPKTLITLWYKGIATNKLNKIWRIPAIFGMFELFNHFWRLGN